MPRNERSAALPIHEKLHGRSWYDALTIGVEGQGWREVEKPYDRLPARAKADVREPVWSLSQYTTGLRVRFVSDAPSIDVRWAPNAERRFDHMPDTGVSGVDMYVKDPRGGKWVHANTGRVIKPKGYNISTMVQGMPPGKREYMIHLPLYNGLDYLHVGVPHDSAFERGPAYPRGKDKPLVFYGTSITHGGCASRPGMSFPAIIARRLERPLINLAFDGNALHEPEIAALLIELDAAVYVLDSPANMGPEMTAQRTEPFVRAIVKAKPNTPVIMVEGWVPRVSPVFRHVSREPVNIPYREAYQRLVKAGAKNLSLIPGLHLAGDDGEGTVDACHPTDLGFMRMAENLLPYIRKAVE